LYGPNSLCIILIILVLMIVFLDTQVGLYTAYMSHVLCDKLSRKNLIGISHPDQLNARVRMSGIKKVI
jgi:hypothetical protein